MSIISEPEFWNISSPLSVNGYIFSNTNKDYYINNSTSITYLSYFSYGFNKDGHLIGGNDKKVLEQLKNTSIAPIMTLTNTNENGSFSSSQASLILRDEQKANTLIEDILKVLKSNNYQH